MTTVKTVFFTLVLVIHSPRGLVFHSPPSSQTGWRQDCPVLTPVFGQFSTDIQSKGIDILPDDHCRGQ